MITTLDKKTRLVLFWCIFVILVFARVWYTWGVPIDINQDEAFAGYNTYTLIHNGKDSIGNTMPMYLTAWGSGMNALESYLAIPFVAVFGLHVWTIRIVPLLVALFSLVVIYRIGREFMKNDIFALFSLFIAGVMPWHIMISRWALESNLAPGFLLFGLYFFLKGMEKEKYYMLSALFYGLALYSYATIWVVLPFILLAQVLYAIVKRRLRFTRYTVIAGVILAILALPAMLFLLVNKDIIGEIRTPFFTIPKLVAFRENEISLANIPENLKTMFHILWTQSDGLPWNSTEEYGLLYHISAPFTISGLIAVLVPPVIRFRKWLNRGIATGNWKSKNEKKSTEPGTISLSFFLIVWLLAGLVVGALISVNVNRINLIFPPLIALTAYGLYMVFAHFTWIRERLVWLPVLVYLFMFVRFEMYYFTDYKDEVNEHFCVGIEETMNYLNNELAPFEHVIITPNISYARVLFYDKTDLNTYLDTVEYVNYPAAYMDVSSFGRYDFTIDMDFEADGESVYVLDHSYDESVLVESMDKKGYMLRDFGRYVVYYPLGV